MPTKPSPVGDDSSVPSINTNFYPQTQTINADLWDKYTPYQLILVKALPNGKYQPTGERFTLPIPPQEVNLDMPVASTVNATLTGVTVHHGGAPFRNISLQGTTGVAPVKNRGQPYETRGVGEAIFAGTTVAASGAVTAIKRAAGENPNKLNVNKGLRKADLDPDYIPEHTTGYYQMRLMERFIESYIALKTGNSVMNTTQGSLGKGLDLRDAKEIRLAFCMWKDEAVYLVEPMQFTKRRNGSSPMEYTFALVLRAWKRIEIEGGLDSSTFEHKFAARDPNLLAQIANRFRAATDFLQRSQEVLEAVINDPVSLMSEAMRETSLFISELQGTKTLISDMPSTIVDECIPSLIRDWRSIRSQFVNVVSPETDAVMSSGQTLTATQKKEVLQKVLSDLAPEQLRIPLATRRRIEAERERVRNLGRQDFEKARDIVQATAADFADRVGAGHATFSIIYDRAEPLSNRVPTDSEMDILFNLNESALALDHLAASAQINPPVPTSLEYVAGLAEKSGIAFQIPRSKFAVPFPYGTTLEQLARTYLGDPQRWHEIATLNGLRAPYVDETGFQLTLLTNGDRNNVVVADVKNLFQGQTVWLSANSVRREKRHILKIETLAPTHHVVTLDGDADLQRFTTLRLAILEAFLPGTVNSQQTIYIPSNNDAPEDPRTKAVPGVDTFDPLLTVSGIDLLLKPDGDLAITNDGDCRLAYGLTNIVQTVRLALSTPRGGLLHHPEYGLPLEPGMSTADVDSNELLKMAVAMFARDPMFSGVRAATVVKEGPALKLTLDVGIAGTSQFVPITVAVKAS